MFKKISLLLMICTIASSTLVMARSIKLLSPEPIASTEVELLQAIQEGSQVLVDFSKTASLDELKALQDYLGYYKSWYQRVTPATQSVLEALSQNALATANKLKALGDRFKIEKKTTLAGATSLSKQGDKYYKYIKTLLANEIALKSYLEEEKEGMRPQILS